MARDHNDVERERQRSEAIGKGLTGNKIYDPGTVRDVAQNGRSAVPGGQSGSGSHRGTGTGHKNQTKCFPKGTLVATPSGPRDIADLQRGDHVLAFSGTSKSIVTRSVVAKKTHRATRLWTIATDDRTLRTTAHHSFLVNGRWTTAAKVKPGDRISVQTPDGITSAGVLSSCGSDEIEEVYNIIVDGDFTFIAGGFVAHSFTTARALRRCVWTVRSWAQGWLSGAAVQPLNPATRS